MVWSKWGLASEYTLEKLASCNNYCIAGDDVPGKERGGAIGSSDAIVANGFVILSNVAAAQPASDMEMQVVSTSVNDAAAGSHAQEVTITYLPQAWSTEYKTKIVVLDGTTPVNTIVDDIYRIEDFCVSKGSSADGIITLKDTGAVTTYAQIDQYTTFFQRCVHYIRTGYKCFVTDIVLGCETNGGVTWRLFRSVKYGDNIVTRGRLSIEVADNTMPHAWSMPVVVGNPNGDRIAIGLAVTGTVATQRGTATIRFYDELEE